jgi:hypothetical protein
MLVHQRVNGGTHRGVRTVSHTIAKQLNDTVSGAHERVLSENIIWLLLGAAMSIHLFVLH